MISVPIFGGKYQGMDAVQLTTLISRNAFVSIYLISCFSTLIDLSPKLTQLFAYSHRIGELDEYLADFLVKSYWKNGGGKSDDKLREICYGNDGFSAVGDLYQDKVKKVSEKDEQAIKTIGLDKDVLLSLSNVSYSPPACDQQLVTELSLSVRRQQNVLITGKAGCGKTSLLRVLLGLWDVRHGNVSFGIPKDQILFLPQRTFLTKGTMRDQLTYPHNNNNKGSDTYKEMNSIFFQVGLQTVISRVGGVDTEPGTSWSDILSPGEVQRLSFARLLYNAPVLAVVDEPTSALSECEERDLYALCEGKGITFITVGHRDSLRAYHQVHLDILPSGKWTSNVKSTPGT